MALAAETILLFRSKGLVGIALLSWIDRYYVTNNIKLEIPYHQ